MRRFSRRVYIAVGSLLVVVCLVILVYVVKPFAVKPLGNKLPTPTLVAHIDLRSYSPQFFRHNVQIGDLNNDNITDFLVYSNSKLMRAFAYNGRNGTLANATLLWEYSFPGIPDPPKKYHYKYTIWDIDNDSKNEVIGPFASSSGIELRILDGATGVVERSIQTTYPNPTSSDDVDEWRLYVTVANFRGLPEPQDLVFLTERDSKGEIYAYDNQFNLLWDTTGNTHQYIYAHFPWTYDIDGDGKDELIGTWVFDDNGTRLWKATHFTIVTGWYNHLDRAFVGDIDPSHEGLEVLVSHEYYRYRMFDVNGTLLREEGPHGADSKIVGVGQINTTAEGFESIVYDDCGVNEDLWCIYGANGTLLKTVSEIRDGYTVDWDGNRTNGDEFFSPKSFGDIYDPWTAESIDFGDFYNRDRYTPADTSNDRQRIFAHVSDVWGDHREEVIIVDEDEILIYSNIEPSPETHPSPWTIPEYRLRVANTEDDTHPERAFFNWQDQP